MTDIAQLTLDTAAALRWLARILGSLMVLFILAFLVGEGGPPPVHRFTGRELAYALAMTLLFGGLVLAWFREGWGGLVSILGWVLFCIVSGRPIVEWPVALPAAIGGLHVVCWLVLRNHSPAPLSRPALFLILIPVAILALLCANEIFGMPPLMTSSSAPPAAMLGTWADTSAAVALTVDPDGKISGTVAGQPVTAGRFNRNRSWFGELLNWRTEYIVIGDIAGRGRFTMPLNPVGPDLRGSLFQGPHGRTSPVRIHLTRR